VAATTSGLELRPNRASWGPA